MADFPALGLFECGRLEACPSHPDVVFEEYQLICPLRLTACGARRKTVAKHDTPSFCPSHACHPRAHL